MRVIPFTHSTKENPSFFHEAIEKEYFRLSSTLLERLTITLRDEKSELLHLFTSQSTVVKLKFKKMQNKEAFVTRFASTDSENIYPENRANKFRVQLPHVLDLESGQWEVALSSIHYPEKLSIANILRNKKNFWMQILTPANNDARISNRNIRFNFATLAEEVDNVTDLLNRINNAVRQAFHGLGILRLTLEQDQSISYSASMLTLRLSPLMAKLMGNLAVTNDMDYFELVSVENPENGRFPGQADLSRCLPNNLLLHSDFIKPILVGGAYSKTLKLIPRLGEETGEKYRTYYSHHLDFVNLGINKISTVEFSLTDISGYPITFQDDDSVTHLNILFRMK